MQLSKNESRIMLSCLRPTLRSSTSSLLKNFIGQSNTKSSSHSGAAEHIPHIVRRNLTTTPGMYVLSEPSYHTPLSKPPPPFLFLPVDEAQLKCLPIHDDFCLA
jgi:hypothetical protein